MERQCTLVYISALLLLKQYHFYRSCSSKCPLSYSSFHPCLHCGVELDSQHESLTKKKTTQTNVYQTSSWKNTFMKIIRFFSYKHHHGYSWLDRKTTTGIKKFLLKMKESGKPEQGTHPWGTNFIIKHRRCFHMHMAYLFITLLDIPLLYFSDCWATWIDTRRKFHGFMVEF